MRLMRVANQRGHIFSMICTLPVSAWLLDLLGNGFAAGKKMA
jgi:hypothetical protein